VCYRVEACKFPPHPDLKKSLLAEVKGAPERRNPWESASISKLDAETAKRNADTAVLKFITTNDIAPLVVESASMRELAVALRQAPPTYVLPSRKQLGMDGGELGSLLESTLIEMRKRKLEALQQVQYIGGDLVQRRSEKPEKVGPEFYTYHCYWGVLCPIYRCYWKA
jgi:hypothetical protein